MYTNTPITIYNQYHNSDTGLLEWHRTVIERANWQGKIGIKNGDKGLDSDDGVSIYIPMQNDYNGKTYLSPKRFERLAPTEVEKYFTFSTNDKVVKGAIEFEITGLRPNTLSYLEQMYDDVLNIASVTVWDQGSQTMQHYKLEAI